MTSSEVTRPAPVSPATLTLELPAGCRSLRHWQTSESITDPIPFPVLLIHGLGGCTHWFDPFAAALPARQIYALELPEYGHYPVTQPLTSSTDLYAVVAQSVKALAQRHQQPVVLLGVSLGGLVALHTSVQFPDLPLKALALISPALKASPQSFDPGIYARIIGQRLFERLGLATSRYFKLPYRVDLITGDATQQARILSGDKPFDGLQTQGWMQLLRMTLFQSGFAQLTPPVALFYTQGDAVCDPRAMVRFYERLQQPQKQCVVYQGVQHDLTLEPDVVDSVAHTLIKWVSALTV
jgi:alpha-beta hydrolase superfamily lysophospholipase